MTPGPDTHPSDDDKPTETDEESSTDDEQSSEADETKSRDADTTAEESEETAHLSTAYVALVRFAFPIAGVVLALLYIESTYGRIRVSNLYYPYFVISVFGLFTVTVIVDEIRDMWGRDAHVSFVPSIKRRAMKWNRSIGLVVIGVIYIGVIELVGFFPASFGGMVSVMALGGLRDPKTMVGVTLLVLVAVYLLFIQIMGLQPPQGVLGL